MPSFRDLLSQVKQEITEVEPTEAQQRKDGAVFLDVREQDEYDAGRHPRRVHLPRGHLEVQVEGRLPDKARPIVVYCAGGTRSAFAAKTLAGPRLHRRRVDGRRLQPVEGRGPRLDHAARAHRRAAQPVPPPPAPPRGGRGRPAEAARVQGAAARRRRPRLAGRAVPRRRGRRARSASSTWTSSTRSNLQRQILHNMDRIGDRKVDSAKKTLTALNPDVNVVTYDVRLGADNIAGRHRRLRRHRRRHRQLPDPLPAERRVAAHAHPVVHGSIFRFEGQVTRVRPVRRARATAASLPEPPPPELAPSCAEAGVLGVLRGIIGSIQALEADQAAPRARRPARRAAARLRRPRARSSARSRCAATRRARRAASDAGEIVIAEYDQLCMPHPKQAPLAS